MSEIVTIAEYKEYLKLNVAETKYDSVLTSMQSDIESDVLGILKCDLFSQEYVEYLNGTGNNEIIPKQFPVTAITQLEVYGGLNESNEEVWEKWAVGSYYQRLMIVDSVKVFMDGAIFPTGTQNIRLSYTAGYSDIPGGIKKACKELLKLHWDNTPYGRNILGVNSISKGNQGGADNTTFDVNAKEKIMKGLMSYARIGI